MAARDVAALGVVLQPVAQLFRYAGVASQCFPGPPEVARIEGGEAGILPQEFADDVPETTVWSTQGRLRLVREKPTMRVRRQPIKDGYRLVGQRYRVRQAVLGF